MKDIMVGISSPFASYFQDCGIIAQYIMVGTPEQTVKMTEET